jgi:hypothetical protein
MITVYNFSRTLIALQTAVASEARIVGGAVRDTVLKRSIHDIDIFLNAMHLDDATRLLQDHGYACTDNDDRYRYVGALNPAVVDVRHFGKAYERVPISLIGMQPALAAHDHVSQLDFGLNMVFFDGWQIHTSPAFDRDREAKAFTLYRADNYRQFVYSMRRYRRFTAERYRGWSLVVPMAFEALAKEYTLRREFVRVGDVLKKTQVMGGGNGTFAYDAQHSVNSGSHQTP